MGAEVVDVEWTKDLKGQWQMKEMEQTNRIIECDLALLSVGFVHCIHEGLVQELGLDLDGRGNIVIDSSFATSNPKVYAAGDSHTGASLVVRAIRNGRDCAYSVHKSITQKVEADLTV